MQKLLVFQRLAAGAACALVSLAAAQATPYATSLTNSGTSISFRLNEAADTVRIISSGGAVTNDLGARSAGLHVVNVTVAGPFKVEVSRGPNLGYLQGVATQISSDASKFVRFNSPRGVAVNQNPASPYFGRIYVANSDNGTITTPARTVTDGIYLLNADFTDAVGQGDTARTAGLDFRTPTTNTANKPFRIEVGEDDNLYVSDYTSAGAIMGNLFVTDPNVADGSGQSVFVADANISGRIPSSAIVKGSLAQANLTVYAVYPDKQFEYDYFGFPTTSFSVMQRWNVGGGPLPSSVVPERVTDLPILVSDVPAVLSDIDIAPDGKYFIAQNRSDGNEGGLFVVDPASDLDFSGYPDIVFNSHAYSLAYFGATNDLLRQTRAVKVAPDGSCVVLARDDSRFWVVPLTNGIPDLAGRVLVNAGSVTLGRDIAFDAVGNVYIATSGHTAVRVFSPGYPSTATTGSDGTFTLARNANDTSIVINPLDVHLYERIPGDSGRYALYRTQTDISQPVEVNLSYAGTAVNGVDYETASTIAYFPPNARTITNALVPLDNALLDGSRTVIVRLEPGGGYTVPPEPNNALTLTIRDDEQAPGPVLYSDDFEADTSGSYRVTFNAVNGVDDKTVAFAYDYSQNGIPAAPHSTGGTTLGLKLTVNKDATGSAAAVNVYPVSAVLSNDFTLRCDMFLTFSSAVAGSTEHSMLGINHSGTNAIRHNVVGSDGVWFAVETDGSASGGGRSYTTYTTPDPAVAPSFIARSARDFDPYFTSPPFIGIPGGAPSGQWVDVEVVQQNNVITWRINGVLIEAITNTTAYTSGTLMLGYMDTFNSVGSVNNFVVFDNVRVINLTQAKPAITAIRPAGGHYEIDFTAGADDAAEAFTLESSRTLPGGFSADPGASISALGSGQFRALSPNRSDAQRFYRVRR